MVNAPVQTVMRILTAYEQHPATFSSLLSSKVLGHSTKQETEVLQTGRWQMLWLSGQFQNVVRMIATPERGKLSARLISSTMFSEFEGDWTVMPEKAGRSSVLHRSVVKPKTRMPIGLGGWLTKNLLEEECKVSKF
eukprot:jgi/Astpho2/983/Aster-x0450